MHLILIATSCTAWVALVAGLDARHGPLDILGRGLLGAALVTCLSMWVAV